MGNWIPSYNTNGLAHHRLEDAVALLAEAGFRGVALTPDVHHLDPFGDFFAEDLEKVRAEIAQHHMAVIVEAGARFNLDSRRKHFPSLMCRRERGVRLRFLERCVDIAADLGAACVSTWSGHNFDGLPPDAATELLVDGLKHVVSYAEAKGVDVGFEPEPGMFVETLEGYERIRDKVGSDRFGLALDVGHLLVTGECDIPEAISRYRGDLLSISIEDMEEGIHKHLPFGEGDVDFPPVFEALESVGYRGLVSVELSGSSANAPAVVRASMEFLEQF